MERKYFAFMGEIFEIGKVYNIHGKRMKLVSFTTIRDINTNLERLYSVTFESEDKKIGWKFDEETFRLEVEKMKASKYISSTPLETREFHFPSIQKIEIKRLPTKVQFNEKKKATTVIFGENVTVVRATEEDTYNKAYGFLLAYFQATCGLSKNKANKYLKKLLEEKELK